MSSLDDLNDSYVLNNHPNSNSSGPFSWASVSSPLIGTTNKKYLNQPHYLSFEAFQSVCIPSLILKHSLYKHTSLKMGKKHLFFTSLFLLFLHLIGQYILCILIFKFKNVSIYLHYHFCCCNSDPHPVLFLLRLSAVYCPLLYSL